MSYIKGILLMLFLVYHHSVTLHAQDRTTAYWQPQVSLNYKVAPLYSHNFSVANRNYVYNDQETQLSVRQLDLAHFSDLKLDFDQSLGLGIQYRFRAVFEDDEENELRFTQQYNITKKIRSIRLGHRLRAEQRIRASSTIHRFRYRFAVDFPLKGLELDVGEPYFVATTESLLSVGKTMPPMYDQRITSQIGWALPKGLKVQFGLEYRAENFAQQTEHVFFFLNSLVLAL